MLLLKSDRQLSTLMSNRSSLHGGRTASAVIPEENDIAQHRRESALLTQFRIARINVRNTTVCLFFFFFCNNLNSNWLSVKCNEGFL